MYIFEVNSIGCNARFYLNNICLLTSNSEKDTKRSILIDLYLVQGLNLLQVDFEVTKENQDMKYEASLSIINKESEQSQTISYLNTNQEEGAALRVVGWHQKNKEFKANSPDWLWHHSPKEVLTEIDKKEIVALLMSYYDALSRKDINEVLQITKIKQYESAIATGTKITELSENVKDFFELVFEGDFKLFPLDPDNIVIEIEANGRIVHILHKKRGHVICEDGGSGYSSDIRVAKIVSREFGAQAQWMIIR